MTEQKRPKYIFPNILANMMAKVDMRTQLEASMLSITLMMVGLILTVIYAWVYLDFALWFKIVTTINAFFGLVFMSSNVVTTYQQYLTYMEAQEMQKDLNKIQDNDSDMKGGNN